MRRPPFRHELAFRMRTAHGEGMTDRVIPLPNAPLTDAEQPLFDRAFREHYPDLLAFVRRRVSTDAEAADVVQEAYVRVLRYREQKELSDLRPLVFRIAMNVVHTRARSARAEHVPLEEELFLTSGQPSQDREVAGQQLLDRLMSVITKLPRKCQQAFILRRFQGLDRHQIAERMGITAKAVDRHVEIAVAACRKKVGKDWP